MLRQGIFHATDKDETRESGEKGATNKQGFCYLCRDGKGSLQRGSTAAHPRACRTEQELYASSARCAENHLMSITDQDLLVVEEADADGVRRSLPIPHDAVAKAHARRLLVPASIVHLAADAARPLRRRIPDAHHRRPAPGDPSPGHGLQPPDALAEVVALVVGVVDDAPGAQALERLPLPRFLLVGQASIGALALARRAMKRRLRLLVRLPRRRGPREAAEDVAPAHARLYGRLGTEEEHVIPRLLARSRGNDLENDASFEALAGLVARVHEVPDAQLLALLLARQANAEAIRAHLAIPIFVRDVVQLLCLIHSNSADPSDVEDGRLLVATENLGPDAQLPGRHVAKGIAAVARVGLARQVPHEAIAEQEELPGGRGQLQLLKREREAAHVPVPLAHDAQPRRKAFAPRPQRRLGRKGGDRAVALAQHALSDDAQADPQEGAPEEAKEHRQRSSHPRQPAPRQRLPHQGLHEDGRLVPLGSLLPPAFPQGVSKAPMRLHADALGGRAPLPCRLRRLEDHQLLAQVPCPGLGDPSPAPLPLQLELELVHHLLQGQGARHARVHRSNRRRRRRRLRDVAGHVPADGLRMAHLSVVRRHELLAGGAQQLRRVLVHAPLAPVADGPMPRRGRRQRMRVLQRPMRR
eukprot:scaffold2660_cov257-Pinguiococcus_pyrenoidosus.AAC.1